MSISSADSADSAESAGAAGGSRPRWRLVLEYGIPSVAVVVTVVAPLTVWARLPEPMAVHFGAGGVPDGAAARLVDLVVLALVTAAIGVVPLVAVRMLMPRWSARTLLATAAGGSVLLAALRLTTLWANLDVAHWTAARDLGTGTVLAAFTAAAVAAAVGAWVASDRPDQTTEVGPVAPAQIPDGHTTVWSSRTTSRLGVLLPAVLLIAAAAGGWLVPGGARTVVLLVLPAAAVATTVLGQVAVTVGPHGLVAGLGWLGWPRLRAPIKDITDVRVEQVEPAAYGGWGLRVVPGATAIVIRKGPGIRVERHNGRALVVTVADAAQGAAILLAHRGRAHATDDTTG